MEKDKLSTEDELNGLYAKAIGLQLESMAVLNKLKSISGELDNPSVNKINIINGLPIEISTVTITKDDHIDIIIMPSVGSINPVIKPTFCLEIKFREKEDEPTTKLGEIQTW